MTDTAWENRLARAWTALDDLEPEVFVERIEELAAERGDGDAIGLFERACARDSTGHSDAAVPLYQAALQRGLTGIRRRRATIQLASSLRNVGRPDEGVKLLEAEMEQPSDELDDAVRATLALALADLGREREGLSLVIEALAAHLPRYQRSMTNYARLLVSE